MSSRRLALGMLSFRERVNPGMAHKRESRAYIQTGMSSAPWIPACAELTMAQDHDSAKEQ